MKVNVIILLGIIIIIFCSCKPKEIILEENYCNYTNWPSNELYLRSSQSAVDSDSLRAVKKSLVDAKANLASKMNSIVNTTTTQWFSEKYGEKPDDAYLSDISIISTALIREYDTCCILVRKKEGRFQSFITIEINNENILQQLFSNLAEDKNYNAKDEENVKNNYYKYLKEVK